MSRQPWEDPWQPDEAWWRALLAFVEQQLLNETEPQVDWTLIARWHAEDQVVELPVTGVNRGGLLVGDQQVQGFVPFSHVVSAGDAAHPPTEADCRALIGQTLCVKVLEFDPSQTRVVFSERAAQAQPGCRHRLLQTLQPGHRYTGTVTLLTDFGAFVDLGGLEGLIHISELSWGRVGHPSEVLQVGDQVEVLVLNVDWERKRLPLSRKRLLPNPWEESERRFPVGTEVTGQVSRKVPFGVFVRLEDEIEGLAHVSQMALPLEAVEVGDEVRVEVLQVEPQRHRLSLRLIEVLSPLRAIA